MAQAMLKIDFMLMHTMFDGFIIDDKFVFDRLGLAIKPPDEQKILGSRGEGTRWRDGQGGTGKCILVLLCNRRGEGGGGSSGVSPNVRGREVGGESTTPSGVPVPL